jgi:hypothetical protein
MVAVCQGYLANAGLFGWLTLEEYLQGAAAVFAG